MMADSQVQTWHRTLLIGSVALISAAAWTSLWQFGASLHSSVHHHHPGAGSSSALLLFVGSWTVMTIAMMLPTSVPIVATFHAIAREQRDRPLLVALVMLGYLAVWVAAGLLFYGGGELMQWAAASAAWWQAHPQVWGGMIVVGAGLYQFTPLKYRCLEKCRSPLAFVLGYWRGEHNRRNAFRLGAHHGLFCVGCCWALMLLMFVVGVGNIAWMLILGAVMAIEKNVSWGRRLSAPLGVLLVAGGVGLLVLGYQ
jgi:predicted metal-binding membrane protein